MNSENQNDVDESAVLLSNEIPDVDDRSIGSVGNILSELNQKKQREQRERTSKVRASTRHNIPIKERMKLLKGQDSKMSRDYGEAGNSGRARRLRATRRIKFEGRRSEESNEQLNRPKDRASMRHNNPVRQRMMALKEESGKTSQEELGAKMEKKKFRKVLFLEALDEEEDEETKKKREKEKLSRDRVLNIRSIRSRARDIRDFSKKSCDVIEEIREQKSEEVMREVTRKPMKLDGESKEDHKKRCEESVDETYKLMKIREVNDAAKEIEKMSLENEEQVDEEITEEVCDEDEDLSEDTSSDDEREYLLSDDDMESTEDDLSYESCSDVISDYSEEDELPDKSDPKGEDDIT